MKHDQQQSNTVILAPSVGSVFVRPNTLRSLLLAVPHAQGVYVSHRGGTSAMAASVRAAGNELICKLDAGVVESDARSANFLLFVPRAQIERMCINGHDSVVEIKVDYEDSTAQALALFSWHEAGWSKPLDEIVDHLQAIAAWSGTLASARACARPSFFSALDVRNLGCALLGLNAASRVSLCIRPTSQGFAVARALDSSTVLYARLPELKPDALIDLDRSNLLGFEAFEELVVEMHHAL